MEPPRSQTGHGKSPILSKRSRSKRRAESFSLYIYKVLKAVHPELGISRKSMSILNSFIMDLFQRMAEEASRLSAYNKRATIGSREIQTAVKLILPGELGKHAVSEGTRAFSKFTSTG